MVCRNLLTVSDEYQTELVYRASCLFSRVMLLKFQKVIEKQVALSVKI